MVWYIHDICLKKLQENAEERLKLWREKGRDTQTQCQTCFILLFYPNHEKYNYKIQNILYSKMFPGCLSYSCNWASSHKTYCNTSELEYLGRLMQNRVDAAFYIRITRNHIMNMLEQKRW